MKKILFVLLMAFCVPMCTVYAQDCSDRIQSAGKLYDKYKKSKDKKQLEEARKQLVNITNTPSNPENCRKAASNLLKTFRPIAKGKLNEVAPIEVRKDTVVEARTIIDSVSNVVDRHDSLKVRRFYETESAAAACAMKKDYECAVDQYQTAVAYGRELQIGESVITVFEAKIERNKQLQYNKMLDEAKQLEAASEIGKALTAYEQAKRYAMENKLLDANSVASLDNKIDYLQSVQDMFDFVEQADEYYRANEWELARQELEMAIDLSDTLEWRRGTIHWIHRLDTLNRIIQAAETTFDYSQLRDNADDYEQMRPVVGNVVLDGLLRFREVDPDTLLVEFLIAPDGRARASVSQMAGEDTMMLRVIKDEIDNAGLRFPAPRYYGQNVAARATYTYVISVTSEITTVTRTPRKIKVEPLIIGVNDAADFILKTEDTVRLTQLRPNCNEFLYGKFYLKNATATLDNISRSGFHLVKYSGTGGPANVLLSMVLPGLGRHRVTYGEQKGVGTAIFYVASLGGALGLRYWSIHDNPYNLNNNMDMKNFFNFGKYDKASFADMEKGQPKRVFYYTSYALAGVAAAIYVGDVLYTLIRGSVNTARQNKYRKWSIGAFYEPASKTPVLQYNYKIR